ncbi:hypothetical protein HMPREF1145_1301 [Oribacterium parvum ACB8]|nr:hypothetical protein HMPREF1145_1301 [Oribacterium parvum ACB8]
MPLSVKGYACHVLLFRSNTLNAFLILSFDAYMSLCFYNFSLFHFYASMLLCAKVFFQKRKAPLCFSEYSA